MPKQTTNAEYRVRVHAAIRAAVEERTGRTADRDLVRAVADEALVTAIGQAVVRLDARPEFPFIHGLPDAAAIAWTDADHGEHIALRYGHPGNGVWRYNDTGYSAADLLDIIGSSTPHPLDFRSSPQTSPSEVIR
ncbi:hypothetical protein [Curtobacterium sp. MCBD17_040]|uniref:hypothetical protein n=1 Tax=Curtobacterium sp. MCBD17_040 TaxID=2175674 RepID=UPI000DA85DCE|nr:hypothetical protein [Curtobacterium sp. MCBD17_040]WIB65363.1 hypothetical protein DEI94_18320 [Curtobacterium sp. MCBD17_040]